MPHTISPIRTDIQDSESGLRRIPLLSTRLNRDKKKEAPASFFLNASLVLDSPFGTYRKARPAPQAEGLRLGPSGNRRRVPLPRSLRGPPRAPGTQPPSSPEPAPSSLRPRRLSRASASLLRCDRPQPPAASPPAARTPRGSCLSPPVWSTHHSATRWASSRLASSTTSSTLHKKSASSLSWASLAFLAAGPHPSAPP